jgi:CRP-like cAMP-binding protein
MYDRVPRETRSRFPVSMALIGVKDSSNRLIAALSQSSRRGLWPAVERVEIARGEVLSRIGTRISHFFFIESGMVSLIKSMQDGKGVEISAVGLEGVAPLGAAFDLEHSVLDSVVQIPGWVLRIRREELKSRLAQDEEFGVVMRSYGAVALSQLAQGAACNILHTVEERCCRWLLMANDCACSDSFPLTHEFLGMTLGVRRASVSVTAEALQKKGLIRYSHGRLTITDRSALEAAACECYTTSRNEIETLFRSLRSNR